MNLCATESHSDALPRTRADRNRSFGTRGLLMRALTFVEIGRVEMADVPRPTVEEPGDALVKITTTAICGSDLHVLNGRIPGMVPGSILGHEFTGVVEEVSPEVKRFKVGDRVLASFMIP